MLFWSSFMFLDSAHKCSRKILFKWSWLLQACELFSCGLIQCCTFRLREQTNVFYTTALSFTVFTAGQTSTKNSQISLSYRSKEVCTLIVLKRKHNRWSDETWSVLTESLISFSGVALYQQFLQTLNYRTQSLRAHIQHSDLFWVWSEIKFFSSWRVFPRCNRWL